MTQNAEQQTVRFTLKQARLFRGQSQESMAEKLGIHRNTYAEWETHPEDISIKNAERISEILNMPIGSIFYGQQSTKCRQ